MHFCKTECRRKKRIYVILLHMLYEIDQSGKIENTSKHTILCIASENDYSYSILLSSNIKKQLQAHFRRAGQSRNFILYTFAALISILINRSIRPHAVVVDREYWGHEHIIAKLVYEMLTPDTVTLRFNLVGKHSPAHYGAYEVFTGKQKAHHVLSNKEMLEALKKTEVGKRLSNA